MISHNKNNIDLFAKEKHLDFLPVHLCHCHSQQKSHSLLFLQHPIDIFECVD